MKRFAAYAMSAVIAVTSVLPTTASAQTYQYGQRQQQLSQQDLVGGLILGAVGLFVLSEIAEDKREKERAADAAARKKAAKAAARKHAAKEEAARKAAERAKPKKAKAKPHRRILPISCIRHVSDVRGRTHRLFARKCMNKNYRPIYQLPRNCYAVVRTHKGNVAGWAPRCLRKHNYVW